jgi:hypothetical protein
MTDKNSPGFHVDAAPSWFPWTSSASASRTSLLVHAQFAAARTNKIAVFATNAAEKNEPAGGVAIVAKVRGRLISFERPWTSSSQTN